jgi:iron complex outermembrane receptor protein
VALAPKWTATAGIKGERNPYTGLEWLPNLRLAWQHSPDNLIWAALSRAVRAPSRIDRELNFPGMPPYVLAGSTAFESEVANVAELGYRSQVSSQASFSATLFHHDYPNLRSLGPGTAGATFRNDIEGKVTGIEAWGSWRVTPSWRLAGGFVVQDVDLRVKPGGIDLGSIASLGNDYSHSANLRSSWEFGSRHELDIYVRHVGALPNPQVPAYTAVDASFTWHVRRNIDLAFTVQNAFDRNYPEWGAPASRAINERSFLLTLWWRL